MKLLLMAFLAAWIMEILPCRLVIHLQAEQHAEIKMDGSVEISASATMATAASGYLYETDADRISGKNSSAYDRRNCKETNQ